MSKTVRHQRGTLSAIRMESLSAIAGIRTFLHRVVDADMHDQGTLEGSVVQLRLDGSK